MNNFNKKLWVSGLIVLIINVLVFSLILILTKYLSDEKITILLKLFWFEDNQGQLSIMYLPFVVALYGIFIIYQNIINFRLKLLYLLLLSFYVGLIYFICYMSFFIIFTYGTYLITGVMPH